MIVFQSIQLVHFIVVCRLGVSTILLTGLAKWFSRTNLPLIMVTSYKSTSTENTGKFTYLTIISLGSLVHK